jgi:hypothetical protein
VERAGERIDGEGGAHPLTRRHAQNTTASGSMRHDVGATLRGARRRRKAHLEVHPKHGVLPDVLAMVDGELAEARPERFHLRFERLDLGERDLGGERLKGGRLGLPGLKGGDPDGTTPGRR